MYIVFKRGKCRPREESNLLGHEFSAHHLSFLSPIMIVYALRTK
ncbi:hypothetical protein E2C01_044362 [Portunus trituberculatus]|uniref:Uncharacterized protein n=1 Tax=Portunus trituberculatus TaxID=210409 RepID=A0A5B7FZT9_PORTR|nr:hypothetical protein [Portunus trituberculatus]